MDQNNEDGAKTLLAERYEIVNATWPESDLPALTDHEATTAARRLYRYGFSLFDIKRTFRGEVRITSGKRHTWVYGERGRVVAGRYVRHRSQVMMINAGKGWHEVVHGLSHYVHHECRPHETGHRDGHAWVERKMIEHVVAQGWLTGKLKRPERAKPDRNVKAENYERVCQRLRKWESRLKRAQTTIKKLRQSRRRYEREGVSAS